MKTPMMMMGLRSLFLRSLNSSRSHYSHAIAAASSTNTHRTFSSLRFPNPLSPSSSSSTECRSPFSNGIGSMRFYSKEVTHIPDIKDPELYSVLKDLLAENWSDLSDAVVSDAKRALSKSTDDSAGKEVVTNVFRAAQAVEEFGGILVTLKMEIDDSIGLSGEDVKPLPDHVQKALRTIFDRYTTYLNAFGPDENYLRKKVEQELGTKMIHLKMRCSGLGSEWGKVTVLGTSGLAGSYVEQRA
ncbi:succinate dehydrogenase subunit 5, mitochondrial isoform X1 [Trifolium pratense]|uniref:succinate dehydrogenase subunit 5, mitochondrial isoform X1 n=1 Tax=Trifolium pratense TaxID=57577 RepID=UPI001E696618|nr:succinate dehydrogenase subunit 5, mitochondrial isoform X1 [Trifolium pratense]